MSKFNTFVAFVLVVAAIAGLTILSGNSMHEAVAQATGGIAMIATVALIFIAVELYRKASEKAKLCVDIGAPAVFTFIMCETHNQSLAMSIACTVVSLLTVFTVVLINHRLEKRHI